MSDPNKTIETLIFDVHAREAIISDLRAEVRSLRENTATMTRRINTLESYLDNHRRTIFSMFSKGTDHE